MTALIGERAVLLDELREVRAQRGSIGLVPTMGALHEGHLALVREARASNDVVVVTVFVNRLQFGSADDFLRYPRDIARDLERAESAGADLVFAPDDAEMFPAGPPIVTVDPGVFGGLLEGRSRPGHFRGVATVVANLLARTYPERAYFGEKDFEQLTVVRRTVADLGFPVEIVAVPTVREADGLALSSRNQRLDPDERAAATVLYRALSKGRDYLRRGGTSPSELDAVMAREFGSEPTVTLDYATARDPLEFSIIDRLDGPVRLLVAARVGPVRLIDNMAVDR